MSGFCSFGNCDFKKVVSVRSPIAVSLFVLVCSKIISDCCLIVCIIALISSVLFSFKNFNGQFVQRRMNKFLKDCNKDNWYNADDISLGVIYLGKIR